MQFCRSHPRLRRCRAETALSREINFELMCLVYLLTGQLWDRTIETFCSELSRSRAIVLSRILMLRNACNIVIILVAFRGLRVVYDAMLHE